MSALKLKDLVPIDSARGIKSTATILRIGGLIQESVIAQTSTVGDGCKGGGVH